MSDPPGEGSGVESTRPSWLRRLPRYVLRFLLLAGLLYVVVINLALQPWAAQRWINQGSKKVEVSWGGGFSIVPGLVHVRDFRIAGEGARLSGRRYSTLGGYGSWCPNSWTAVSPSKVCADRVSNFT